jgi:hypothetical protein
MRGKGQPQKKYRVSIVHLSGNTSVLIERTSHECAQQVKHYYDGVVREVLIEELPDTDLIP